MSFDWQPGNSTCEPGGRAAVETGKGCPVPRPGNRGTRGTLPITLRGRLSLYNRKGSPGSLVTRRTRRRAGVTL